MLMAKNAAFTLFAKNIRKSGAPRRKMRDDVAKLCINAASNFVRAIPNEAAGCCCCDTFFSPDDKPPAFIILIPVEEDPEIVRAHAKAVCAECSSHDDEWLIEQGVRREGLAPTPPRPGDRVH
jgi:hypothetical protein